MRISKNLFAWIGAIAIIVVGIVLFMSSDLEHIEDTNGAGDYSLTTITDENILGMDTGSLGGPNIKTSVFTNTVEISAEKFTGVYEILYDNLLGKSDFVLDLTTFNVTGGNFRMVVVHDGEIVAEIEPGDMVQFRLDDINGYVSLRIAGESAAFSFTMSKIDYDMHTHS